MIGQHEVRVVPDASTIPWSAALNSNPNMTTDIAGWAAPPFDPPWVWAAPGVAKWVSGNVQLRRATSAPIARNPDVSNYRVVVKGTVTAPNEPAWIIPGLTYGRTAAAAYGGSFWAGSDAIDHGQWFPIVGTAATFEFTLVSDTRQVPPGFSFLGPNIALFTPVAQPGLALSVDSITLQGQSFDYVDVSCLVDQVAINHGRSDTGSQPDASTATLDLSYDSGESELPDGFDVGSLVEVATVLDGVRSVRFSGNVTDLKTGWDDAGSQTPHAVVAQVIAAGPLADAGRRIIGDEPWPQELDGARVARIMREAGFSLDAVTSDPGTMDVLARDVDAQASLGLAQEVAISASGILWESRTGAIRYADNEHRRNVPASLMIDACDVLVTPTWRRDTEGLINAVSIGYGETPEGGEQPRVDGVRTDSQARFGRYELSTSTVLARTADAEALASLLLTRNAAPVWVLSELPVDVFGLSLAETHALLALDMHDLLAVTGLPTTGALPSSTSLWVEGWSETLAAGVHELALWVSGYCRTSPPPFWDDVPAEWTWNTLPDPTVRWDDASCFGPPVSAGRWADVPASLRWDWVAPAVTWNTWPY